MSEYAGRPLPPEKPVSATPSEGKAEERAGLIPGLMPAMTMQYQAEQSDELKKASPGDHIQADLIV